jgi:hypothetical protein
MAYHSFGGEVEASNTPTIRRLTPSRRHQLPRITREHKEQLPAAAAYASGAMDSSTKLGLNLSYTINLNLPATSDQAVFNAIFKSLKEHLITNE